MDCYIFSYLNCRRGQGIQRCPRIHFLFKYAINSVVLCRAEMAHKNLTEYVKEMKLICYFLFIAVICQGALTATRVTKDQNGTKVTSCTITSELSKKLKLSDSYDNKSLLYLLYKPNPTIYFVTKRSYAETPKFNHLVRIDELTYHNLNTSNKIS